MTGTTVDFSDIFLAFIADRTKDFTGREWVFAEIDRWLADPKGPSFFIITGEPGVGKSAIAARLTQVRDLAAYHFCIARQADTIDPAVFARSLSHQLCRIDGFALGILKDSNVELKITQDVMTNYGQVVGARIENLVVNAPSGSVAFTHAVTEPLKALCDDGYENQVVLLVDALDEAVQHKGSETIVDLLANAGRLPGQVRFVLTSRPEGAALRHFQEREIPHFCLDAGRPENLEDIRRYVRGQLEGFETMRSQLADQRTPDAHFVERVTTASQGNFLYVVWLLRAMAGGTRRFDALQELPQGLDGIYREFLRTRRVGADQQGWRGLYRPLLGVLVAAQAPLTAKQVEQFTKLSSQDVDDGLQDLRQFLDPGSADEGRYFLYHQSVSDWLQNKKRSQEFWIDPTPAHARIVSFYRAGAGDWTAVNWQQVEDYGLRYLPLHIYAQVQAEPVLIDDGGGDLADDLRHLLLDSRFGSATIERFWSPLQYLDNLRLGLAVALARNDAIQIWGYVNRYREILQNERRPERVVAETRAGNFETALERTSLYADMPNSQRMFRLWIAWCAALFGQIETAKRAATMALAGLPVGGSLQEPVDRDDPSSASILLDAQSTALQHLLIRLTRSIADFSPDGMTWLREATVSWSPKDQDAIVQHLADPLMEWGKSFGESSPPGSLNALLREFHAQYVLGEYPKPMRDVAYEFQDKLAAALYHERSAPNWQEQVARVVRSLSLEDYPSYRELALAWTAVAVLCQEDDSQAHEALGAVIVGALSMPAPGFGGNMVTATLVGLAKEVGKSLRTDGLADALKYTGMTTQPLTPPNARFLAELPEDPWAFDLLSQSAIAAVLRQQGKLHEAEAILDQASQPDHRSSYAGYRILARLALACRWLEWSRSDRGKALLLQARKDATHMKDGVLGRERERLVNVLERWLADMEDQPQESWNADTALRNTQDLTGMVRSLRIQFLAAMWSEQPEQLKRLVPLALADVTAMDAVLGRLFIQWGKQAKPGQPFRCLAQAMGIEDLGRWFNVEE